ncbi:tetratricopeptide repeat protein [Streptomyces sp. KLOTTS4A1]|uniref:tetratricopeptide repeat protein n=1 Tax=Streptomyces sp. KLOTTS4A1 TaxID=3390996 RepID=UPI0039F49D64
MEQGEAGRLVGRAQAAWEAGEWLRAAELYERVLAHYPDEEPSASWWYDAALAYKFLRNWEKAYELGREAAARAPRGAGDPAYWDLGIAATVRREWAVARDAWRGFGVRLPDGEGRIDAEFGTACVRLDTDGVRETVRVRRLCPTRGRVVSVPVTSGRRFGEVVVHDGVPSGERSLGGRTFAVFDELALFEPSGLPTLHVAVDAPATADIAALVRAFTGRDFGARPDGSRLRLAAPEPEARALLDAWSAAHPGRSWSDLGPGAHTDADTGEVADTGAA